MRRVPGAAGFDLDWAPDGKRIAFSSDDSFDGDIYVVAIAGGHKRLLLKPDPTMIYESPTWSPDGKAIAVEGYAYLASCPGMLSPDYDESCVDIGDSAIAVVHLRGKQAARVPTGHKIAGGEPAWSPHGKRIAFVRHYELFIMNADGTGARSLTTKSGPAP